MNPHDANELPFVPSVPVPPELARAYMAYHDQVPKLEFIPEEADALVARSGDLFAIETSTEWKQRCLFLLAHIGTPSALEVIERYIADADPELESWSLLCRDECRAFVSGELGANRPLVITDIGGTGAELAYHAIFTTRDGEPLDGEQALNLAAALQEVADARGIRLLAHTAGFNFLLFSFRLHLDHAVGEAVDEFLDACMDRVPEVLRDHYYVGTSDRPTEAQILAYLKIAGEEADE